MDGFDRLLSNKTDTMKISMRLTIVGVVIEALHLLLYIALYSGADYARYPQFQGPSPLNILQIYMKNKASLKFSDFVL